MKERRRQERDGMEKDEGGEGRERVRKGGVGGDL